MRFRLPRELTLSRAKAALKRLYVRAQGRRDDGSGPSVLESRAARVIREYLRTQATNLERAERLKERAERLETAGIPSESARNRAERARREVAAGLAALRTSFVEVVGSKEGASAFDRVVELLCPAFKPRGLSDGRS